MRIAGSLFGRIRMNLSFRENWLVNLAVSDIVPFEDPTSVVHCWQTSCIGLVEKRDTNMNSQVSLTVRYPNGPAKPRSSNRLSPNISSHITRKAAI
jgi:hypothetical protein